ncbi:MAG: SDR family oxidoreductase [Alphaproteobacteria bacterium]|nr:SDR family oxidoreductase [Alphaproteobacteria bacterium]
MGRCEGKVVYITGGASGIGKESAAWLVREGARVALADINEAAVKAVAEPYGDKAICLRHDVTNEADWPANLEAARSHFGKLDVVVNCAGIVVPGNPVEMTLEQWRRVFTVNVDGSFLCGKHAIPVLAAQGGGQIIQFCSIASYSAASGLIGYCASKAAVRSLYKSQAKYCKEQANGVRVNGVFPGPILTPMTNNVLDGAMGAGAHEQFKPGQASPFGVLGAAEDIAAGVLFLVSDESKYANGTELMLDGGTTL